MKRAVIIISLSFGSQSAQLGGGMKERRKNPFLKVRKANQCKTITLVALSFLPSLIFNQIISQGNLTVVFSQ